MAEVLDGTRIPLEQIDVSRPELYRTDTWQPWFTRLRKEAPVHCLADSSNEPFWSVTSHKLIKEVDASNVVFSSEAGGIGIADPPKPGIVEHQIQTQSFIGHDEPKHMPQRRSVAPSVAPKTLAELEPLNRERAIDMTNDNAAMERAKLAPFAVGAIRRPGKERCDEDRLFRIQQRPPRPAGGHGRRAALC